MGWLEFALAYVVFFLTHSIPVRQPMRTWLRTRLGQGGYTLVYSLLSLAALAWLIAAAGRAPFMPLWSRADWQGLVPLVVMLPVCLVLAFGVARPNPFSFGGVGNSDFDPARPGIVRWARHPLLLALTLWSAAHLVPNGDLAHVILFGTFAGFASLGGRLVDRRKRREMGAEWKRLQTATADAPLVTWPWSRGVFLRLLAGLALYAALIWMHPFLFGVSPLP